MDKVSVEMSAEYVAEVLGDHTMEVGLTASQMSDILSAYQMTGLYMMMEGSYSQEEIDSLIAGAMELNKLFTPVIQKAMDSVTEDSAK